MELQALLVLCGVGVVAVAVVLLMGLFSASGTSYEEAIAQQRRAATELLALAENKNKPKKNNKKANKKLAKKEKNKEATVATGDEQESEAPAESGVDDDPAPGPKPHVEFSSAVVVDATNAPPNVKIRKRGKDPKVKPILINKGDPSCISDPNAVTPGDAAFSNHFEEMHPKDEFELMHSSLTADKVPEKKEEVVEKKENKPAKQAKGGKGNAAAKQPAGEAVKEEEGRERRNSGNAAKETPKEQRKAKKVDKKSVSEETPDAAKEEVIPPLNVPQPSELTTEKLLKQVVASVPTSANTASPPGGKNKKKKAEPNMLALLAAGDGGGVNVGELVRVVRDAALSRTEIQILTDALLNKHHDPLPEHSEWTEGPNDPVQKMKKQLADKEKALADEIEASQAVHAKLKELRAQLNMERTRATAAARATEEAASEYRIEVHTLQERLKRLMEDNQSLAQDKLVLKSKLGAEGDAQKQCVQMEMHIQRLSESEAALVQQLNALQAELNARVLEAGQARCEAAAARDSMILAQQHAAELAQQLQEANRMYGEVEQQRQMAVQADRHAQQELRQAQDRLNSMVELQNEVQRLTSRAQAAENNADKLKDEAEKQKQQLSTELATLKEQLAARESELAEVKQMKVVPAQNGLPPSNAADQHKAAELAKVESVVEALRGELAAAQRCSREQRDQLAALHDQLQHYQHKNNDLRTKNWKVMEALQSAEKALQTKSASALPAQDSLRDALAKAQESQYNDMVAVLRAACPSAAPGTAAGRDWLHTFAANLKQEIEKRDAEKRQLESREDKADAGVDARLADLVAQNEQLQGLVDKYKRIIDDTEGVLSRLQQNVSTEEARWAQQLADKQRELDDLRQRTLSQMQNKIDSLQSELQQAQSANHNHTFADAERQAEERLMMAGLSEKHGTDLRNGPLQVGLEEK